MATVTTLIEVTTPVCGFCDRAGSVLVDAKAYDSWKSGALIQVAFPDESADFREMLKTGTHPDCWDSMLPPEL